MSFAEVVPAALALPRAEKFRLAQLLLQELANEEGGPLLEPGHSYPIWSQYDAYEAVPVLMQALEEARKG